MHGVLGVNAYVKQILNVLPEVKCSPLPVCMENQTKCSERDLTKHKRFHQYTYRIDNQIPTARTSVTRSQIDGSLKPSVKSIKTPGRNVDGHVYNNGG